MTAPIKPAPAVNGSIASGLEVLLKRPLVETIFRRRTHRVSQGSSVLAGRRTSLATTAAPPYRLRSARVSSEPICPQAPVTRMRFMGPSYCSSAGIRRENRAKSSKSYAPLRTPAQRRGQPKLLRSRSAPARSGATAEARLRGTLVTLDAAARSSRGTIAIT